MRMSISRLAAVVALGFGYAAAACENPSAVPSIPDGKSSTMEQMLAAQAQVKS